MKSGRTISSNRNVPRQTVPGLRSGRRQAGSRPVTAHRQRGVGESGDEWRAAAAVEERDGSGKGAVAADANVLTAAALHSHHST